MKNKGHGTYVQKVREDTQRYVQDLLNENETLRRRLAGLESEVATLERDKGQLERQILELRQELESDRRQHEELRRRLAETEGQSRAFSERYVEVEQQNSNLANLYVAGYRLHGTLDRREVLEAIQEIIINLIGCEELGIFEMGAQGSRLSLVASFGIDKEVYHDVEVGAGLIGRVAQSGELFLAGPDDDGGRLPEEDHLTACIPLAADGKVVGAIAVFRLLPQKTEGLGVLDHELFDLLATQAGIALYSCALHATVAAGAARAETHREP